MTADRTPLYAAFARLLEYPGAALEERLAAARAAPGLPARAADRLDRLAAAARAAGVPAMQEAYTAAFDLDPLACPYVGHQLVGESPQRGLLLAKLLEVYEAAGFVRGAELPDHLTEVLRFLAQVGDARGEGEVVLREGLAPAVRKMAAALDAAEQPYADLVGALLAVVEDAVPALPAEARPRTDRTDRMHRMEALP